MAKRRLKKPEEKIVGIIALLSPHFGHQRIKILKAVAIMMEIPSFSHDNV